MQFTTALMAALMAGSSLATINFGKARYDSGNVDNAIWIDGENACTYVYQGHDNPCDFNGGKFQAQNGVKCMLISILSLWLDCVESDETTPGFRTKPNVGTVVPQNFQRMPPGSIMLG